MSAIDLVNAQGVPEFVERVFYDCNPVDGTDKTFQFNVWGDRGTYKFYLEADDADELNRWLKSVFGSVVSQPLVLPLVSANGKSTEDTLTIEGNSLGAGSYFELQFKLRHTQAQAYLVVKEAERLQITLEQDLEVG